MHRIVWKRFDTSPIRFNQSSIQLCWNFQYESQPEVNKVLEDGVLTLREEIVCFNMGSVIIKPVQRILKYPLMLNELIKVPFDVG